MNNIKSFIQYSGQFALVSAILYFLDAEYSLYIIFAIILFADWFRMLEREPEEKNYPTMHEQAIEAQARLDWIDSLNTKELADYYSLRLKAPWDMS